MKYFMILFILCSGYYTLTYGISLQKDKANKLGSFGAILAAAVGTFVPILFILFKG